MAMTALVNGGASFCEHRVDDHLVMGFVLKRKYSVRESPHTRTKVQSHVALLLNKTIPSSLIAS
jgi:hypothetical protein